MCKNFPNNLCEVERIANYFCFFNNFVEYVMFVRY